MDRSYSECPDREYGTVFVPAGVGIMVAFDILAKSWHEILFISLVSTVCVIAAVV